ncbi:MAG: hypothetical protein KDJ35_04160 [Alphaproteobacteria bacterium]|nr:hypothetical protein [Alphaproteobacteria bacterium]
MLSDFLLLETYFEGPETVQFYEDLSKRYGRGSVDMAESEGFLVSRPVLCGPYCGKRMVWLSELGRQQAVKASSVAAYA